MTATITERLQASEAASRFSHDLLEQAPDSGTGQALAEALRAIAALRGAVRAQQAQIAALQAAVPSGTLKE